MALLMMLLAALAIVSLACGAKIVSMPYPGGISHVFIAAKIGIELAARGHEVRRSVGTGMLWVHVASNPLPVLQPPSPKYSNLPPEGYVFLVGLHETFGQGCMKDVLSK